MPESELFVDQMPVREQTLDELKYSLGIAPGNSYLASLQISKKIKQSHQSESDIIRHEWLRELEDNLIVVSQSPEKVDNLENVDANEDNLEEAIAKLSSLSSTHHEAATADLDTYVRPLIKVDNFFEEEDADCDICSSYIPTIPTVDLSGKVTL